MYNWKIRDICFRTTFSKLHFIELNFIWFLHVRNTGKQSESQDSNKVKKETVNCMKISLTIPPPCMPTSEILGTGQRLALTSLLLVIKLILVTWSQMASMIPWPAWNPVTWINSCWIQELLSNFQTASISWSCVTRRPLFHLYPVVKQSAFFGELKRMSGTSLA